MMGLIVAVLLAHGPRSVFWKTALGPCALYTRLHLRQLVRRRLFTIRLSPLQAAGVSRVSRVLSTDVSIQLRPTDEVRTGTRANNAWLWSGSERGQVSQKLPRPARDCSVRKWQSQMT
jgi:hypothetical protein